MTTNTPTPDNLRICINELCELVAELPAGDNSARLNSVIAMLQAETDATLQAAEELIVEKKTTKLAIEENWTMQDYPLSEKTNVDDLSCAIKEFETNLPGCWWSIGHCLLTRDASCGPDRQGLDANLLSLADTKQFDEGFHCDDKSGTLASSLRNVMQQAIKAKTDAAKAAPTQKNEKTLRDEFAFAKLSGIVWNGSPLTEVDMKEVAAECYKFADVMLETRNK